MTTEKKPSATYGTDTSQGFVPHLAKFGIHLPVKIVRSSIPGVKPKPLIRDDRYVYALPGGADYIPGVR